MAVLVIAEHDNSVLKTSTFNTITAATNLSEDIRLLIIGKDIETLSNNAKSIYPIKKVLKCDNSKLENFIPELSAPIISNIANGYTHILAPATTFGKNLMPRISAKLDSQQISDIISVESDDTFKRPIYAGSCIATVKSNDDVKIITVRSTAFDAATTNNSGTEVSEISAEDSSGMSKFVGEELAQSDRPELTAANIVISGGRGMQSGDNFHLLDSIADKLGAAVGASRAAVDAGFVPNDYQVGQTGKIVAPDLYIAVGISGAIQHLAGINASKVKVVINTDPEAPFFKAADYGVVGDAFDVVPQLISKLKDFKAQNS